MAEPEPSTPLEESHTNGAHNEKYHLGPEARRDSDPETPAHMAAPQASHPASSVDPAMEKATEAVLYSDAGVNALLVRLKQSVATARDLAAFLKKRHHMEDDHSKELRRLCRFTTDSIRNRESRQDSFAGQFVEIISMHERMAENEMSFGLNLHQMSVDLDNLAHEIERGRKQWKAQGLSAEQRVQEAEKALDKAKQKYDSLAEDYDHAKTGDKVSGRHMGFRPKSGAALEEDLQRKLNVADQDYQTKVQAAQQLREELEKSSRPQAVQSMLQLIKECDSGVTLQLQKFASFNEKLLLGNGLLISPLINDGESQRRSLREMIGHIDNDRDFHNYITSHPVPPRRENKYEQHPTQIPSASRTTQPPSFNDTTPLQQPRRESSGQIPPQFPMGAQGPIIPTQSFQPFDPMNEKPPQHPPYHGDSYSPQGPSGRGYPPSSNQHYGPGPGPGPGPGNLPPGPGGHGQRPQGRPGSGPMGGSPGGPMGGSMGGPIGGPLSGPMGGHMGGPMGSSMGVPMGSSMGGPMGGHTGSPVGGPMGGHTGSPVGGPMGGMMGGPMGAPRPGSRQNFQRPPPARPVFGVPLNDLFIRDQSPVPMIVYQCIQAVEQFGLDFEGIYRVSGSTPQIGQLRDQFDHDAQSVDFRNPKAFYHDVNNPSTLLKQFLRELPDPLFTNHGYREFLDAAAVPDDIQRRDRLHAAINNLPDPNYATLRALTLHLRRVVDHGHSNRMDTNNLSLIFAPTLMGTHNGPVQDQALQHRAIETILLNSLQIFDED